MKKRIWACLLSTVMLASALPIDGMAENLNLTYDSHIVTVDDAETTAEYADKRPDIVPGTAITVDSEVYINPIYQDVETEDSIPTPEDVQSSRGGRRKVRQRTENGTTTDYCDTVEEAAAVLREGMKERKTEITVRYYGDSYTQAYFEDLCKNQIAPMTFAETGVPTEGDYLRYNYGGFGYTSSISKDENNQRRYYTITFTPKYYTTAEQEAAVTEKVDELTQNPSELGITKSSMDFEKIYAVHDYICKNVTYDHENLQDENYNLKYTTYAALINKTAVCQGYATLQYRLLRELGISVRVATGYGGEKFEGSGGVSYRSNHAWNIISLNDKWYYSDATWDAGSTTYQYFLKGSNDFDTLSEGYSTTGIHVLIMEQSFVDAYPMQETQYHNHNWEDTGESKPATLFAQGKSVQKCSLCDETKTEIIQRKPLTLAVSKNGSKIRLIGMTELPRSNVEEQTTSHGFVYATKLQVGARTLTVNTAGRTKVTIRGCNDDGSYSYSMTPKTSDTVYVMRAFVTYKNDSGKTVYNYSDPVYVSYSQLPE